MKLVGDGSRYQLVVPDTLEKGVLRLCHALKTPGHFGVTKTLAKLRENFY